MRESSKTEQVAEAMARLLGDPSGLPVEMKAAAAAQVGQKLFECFSLTHATRFTGHAEVCKHLMAAITILLNASLTEE